MKAEYDALRHLGKTVDGGVFFNKDGSVVFHSLHAKHLVLLLMPIGFIPMAWEFSWWFLAGIPLSLAGVIHWLIKRKKKFNLRLDVPNKQIIKGEYCIPFAQLGAAPFRAVHERDESSVQCTHPRLEMTLPLRFTDIGYIDTLPEPLCVNYKQRAEAFASLLNACISSTADARPNGYPLKCLPTKVRTAAQRKDIQRSLSSAEQWMLRPGDILAYACGLRSEGIFITDPKANTQKRLLSLLQEKWDITTPEEGRYAFGRCLQGVRGLLAAIQPIALLPHSAQHTYLEHMEKAVAEVCEERQKATEAGLPETVAIPPGPALSQIIALLYDNHGVKLLEEYAQATYIAYTSEALALFLEIEDALCFQAQVFGEIVFIGLEARLVEIYGKEFYTSAAEPLIQLLRNTTPHSQKQAQTLLRLHNIKRIYSSLLQNSACTQLEQERLNALSQTSQAILLGRNPYIAWDYAKACFLKRITYTLGWEESLADLWVDLRPAAENMQQTFVDWPDILPFIILGHRLDGSSKEFGSSNSFSAMMRSGTIQKMLVRERLSWKQPLTSKK